MTAGEASFRQQQEPPEEVLRLCLEVRGTVQGVGFRPFVYRLAAALGLKGWVKNTARGALIEAEGRLEELSAFLRRLREEKPPVCTIDALEQFRTGPAGYTAFEVRPSDAGGAKAPCVLPDLATCPDCLRELADPSDRRFRYPFSNCTNCGPRFSIVESLPYDRARTTMRRFPLCRRCRAEYEDPADRRFHAQPNACPDCGPHLELWDPSGAVLALRDGALRAAADALRRGGILALKGLGGFHLLADARDDEAVSRLRRRKAREARPFALMYPGLSSLAEDCRVSAAEEALLCSPEAPIVLLRRQASAAVAASVAPGNPYLGCMLPYTPLHHLLLAELGFPVVATSGNRSDEPICTDEREALARLGGIADLFLVHDRPIARPVDDSVARLVLGQEMVLRRARGYAPLPLPVGPCPGPLLATGAHLKNTIAVAAGGQACLSQHLGDLETGPAFEAFRKAAADLPRLYEVQPQIVVCDEHPDYLSTQFAEGLGLPVLRVQHHQAHVRACMAEHGLEGPVLGVAWDGTGHGPDGTVWGGEFLRLGPEGCERVTHLRRFRLPGGDRAAREPRRSALGLLYELLGEVVFAREDLAAVRTFTPAERRTLRMMLERGVSAPLTSSAGRLFDAVASLLGLHQQCRFEGQAAMELEFALDGVETEEAYPFALDPGGVLDWEPMIRAILAEGRTPPGLVAARFHNTLVEMIVTAAGLAGERRIVLTGGCFQNVYLLERAVRRLQAAGFEVFRHRRVPPNDGGIALGQVAAAAYARAVPSSFKRLQ